MSSEYHYFFRYDKTGLLLLKHYLIEGTQVDFSEDNTAEIIASHWPTENGATFRMLRGMKAKDGEIYGPGDILDLQGGIITGQYEKERWVEVIKSGYTLCLMSTIKTRIETSLVDCSDFVLPPNTKAIPMSGEVVFWDQNMLKVASKYNLILERPYSLQLNGTGKLMLINISG